MNPADAFDVIVIGTGMGGATIGRCLVQAGLSVLFVEKGKARGVPEPDGDEPTDPAVRFDASRWPDPVEMVIDGVTTATFLPLGCGAGGSTLFYAAALERMEPIDMGEGEGAGPAPWPIRWKQWARHYDRAERLYGVAGTHDPLSRGSGGAWRAPPRASGTDQLLMQAFGTRGLHPYRLHVGLSYRPGCGECGGRKCLRACKRDARIVSLEPALATGRARLMAEAEVLLLEADTARVTGVMVRHHGHTRRLAAPMVILAAGAYHSPALLLRSRSPLWPDGLANGSGQVGRNLMFHANEWFAVWPPRRADASGPRKTIGFRDLAAQGGVRMGTVQSTGLSASYGHVMTFLTAKLRRSRLRHVPFTGLALRIAARIGTLVAGSATTFVMLIEDYAHPHNRVVLHPNDPARIRVHYRIPDELRARAAHGRRAFRRALRGLRVLPLQADVDLNFGHPCGTCRFGEDPATSVLDPNCKAHQLDNLYVVDASFMPTSGGVNPALTIAANALRVGDIVAQRMKATLPQAVHP